MRSELYPAVGWIQDVSMHRTTFLFRFFFFLSASALRKLRLSEFSWADSDLKMFLCWERIGSFAGNPGITLERMQTRRSALGGTQTRPPLLPPWRKAETTAGSGPDAPVTAGCRLLGSWEATSRFLEGNRTPAATGVTQTSAAAALDRVQTAWFPAQTLRYIRHWDVVKLYISTQTQCFTNVTNKYYVS